MEPTVASGKPSAGGYLWDIRVPVCLGRIQKWSPDPGGAKHDVATNPFSYGVLHMGLKNMGNAIDSSAASAPKASNVTLPRLTIWYGSYEGCDNGSIPGHLSNVNAELVSMAPHVTR